MSITDELMQIFNRRYLMHRLDDELERIKRYDYPLSILMLDIDFFKNINDKFGHIQGDNALRGLGLLLKKNIRAMDILCRYGGEEIVIILPHMNAKGSLLTAERLRTKVCETDFGTIEIPLKFTISIGLVTLEETADIGIDGLFQLLDQQLYKAKNSGRNQVSAAVFRNNTAV
jgi:diguanylate cyclase (GGDEF) domain